MERIPVEIIRTVLESVLDLVRRSTSTQQQLSVHLITLWNSVSVCL